MDQTRKVHPPRGSRLAHVTPTDPLLPPAGAAAYLGVAVHTLETWRSARRPGRFVPFVKVGGLIRYRKSALDAFLSQGEVRE
jgi:helix-turn-helix protein